jgi:hypothetical protein
MRLILIAAALAAAAMPPSVIAAPGSDYSVKDTRRLVHDYAKCVVSHRAAAASEALLTNVDNDTILSRYGELIEGGCLVSKTHASAKMTFPGDLYRYALADALFARELASSPVPDLSSIPPLEHRALPSEPAPPPANARKKDVRQYEEALRQFNEAKGYRVLSALGECVVRLNAAGAKALLLTAPETQAERPGFDALRPAIAQCLPEGTTLALGKLALRGTIAVNYYRLAYAARSSPRSAH